MTLSSTPSLPLARLLGHTADAVQAVRAGQSLTDALARCPSEARPGTQALSFHVLRWLGSAMAARAQLADKPPPAALDALLLSALALLWPTGDEPPYAAHTLVDQAVTAARKRDARRASFVNAVLRRFMREREAIVEAAERDPVAVHNHPVWWAERLGRDWPEEWQALLAANNRRPPMTLRINARRGDAATYLRRLHDAGLSGQAFGSHTLVLDAPCPVTRLPGFAEGDVSVQDAGAQIAAPLLLAPGEGAPRPGARVLDACAAPGGKTGHLLELADLDVLALDSDPARLLRVDETLSRLQLKAQTACADAADPAAWWDGRPFDAILLDAPCTASGIVRRHPDVRWLRRPTDIPALAQTQARLLDALWPTLAPGGRLLYCTCSVFKAEGQDQIDAFLQRQPGAGAVKQPASPGHLLPLPDNGMEAAAPPFGASPDGFYYALLQKKT
ncbi:MAG TPA: 16S rRNA (cytosine(967)-C(5))-methyltransferase RsmB [Albitalea sp.]|uniref:16S rRNA (cytosine(967)-C(5))-methyltransferase RsmB n=1 Tax=Piscinibacter sp. TaxID=1903157 RepID=UPI002ED5B16C